MRRISLLGIALLAGLVWGRSDQQSEAASVVASFLSGDTGVTQIVNRITFLDQEEYATDALLAAYRKTTDVRKRVRIVEVLGEIAVDNNEVEALFIRGLDSDDNTVVFPALKGLTRVKSQRAVPKLINLLKHRSSGIRNDAAKALGSAHVAKAGRLLIDAANAEKELEVRVTMIVAAGQTGAKDVVRPLESFLSSESESTKLAAARALCRLNAPKGIALATNLLSSKDPEERRAAVLLFDGAALKVAAGPLKRMLSDGDARVRATTARVLYAAGDKAKLEWLVIESYKAQGDDRMPFVDELERLNLSSERRREILKGAGLE
jgi:HEAT repeat protein